MSQNERAAMRPEVKVLREDWADPAVPLPSYETKGAAGADVAGCAAMKTIDTRSAVSATRPRRCP